MISVKCLYLTIIDLGRISLIILELLNRYRKVGVFKFKCLNFLVTANFYEYRSDEEADDSDCDDCKNSNETLVSWIDPHR